MPLRTTHSEPLPRERTVPFSFAEPVTAITLRVRAVEKVALAQLEMFDL